MRSETRTGKLFETRTELKGNNGEIKNAIKGGESRRDVKK